MDRHCTSTLHHKIDDSVSMGMAVVDRLACKEVRIFKVLNVIGQDSLPAHVAPGAHAVF